MPKPEYSVSQLELREILSPEDQPGRNLAARLSAKEAVHPVAVNDLITRRMEPHVRDHLLGLSNGGVWNRHCYGLFAPECDVPEAVIYTHLDVVKPEGIAGDVLNQQLPGGIAKILRMEGCGVHQPNLALFYSVTNMGRDADHPVKIVRKEGECSPAEALIGRVAGHLKEQYGIRNLATLSPLRSGVAEEAKGFAQWLERECAEGKTLLTPDEQALLHTLSKDMPGANDGIYTQILAVHQRATSLTKPQLSAFETLMCGLGAMYLLEARKDGRPENAVEQFHLGNGAEIGKIHYLPEPMSTPSDQRGSLGLMVNYRYVPELQQHWKSLYQQGHVLADTHITTLHAQRMHTLGLDVRSPGTQIHEAVKFPGKIHDTPPAGREF